MTRIAINGFGRIGRCVLRALVQRTDLADVQLVAINEPAPLETIAHLLRYDSTHGPWSQPFSVQGKEICVADHRIAVSHHEDITKVRWPDVDLVIECSGAYETRKELAQHLEHGAKRVLLSQPGRNEMDATVIFGLNESSLQASHTIASAASCTTNAVAPVIDYLQQEIGIESGVITTIHSAMNDQPVIDAYHHTDLRKTRSAMRSVIPVDTGLARGIDRVLPELSGKFEAQAMRVPTIDVSAIDLSVVLKQSVDVTAINQLLEQAAHGKYRNILGVSYEPLASCDYVGEIRSGVVDASQTRVAGGKLVKLLIWFDNEWGYSNRVLDVAKHWLHS